MFGGQLHTFQLYDGMSAGKALYEADLLHADVREQRASAMADYEALVAWYASCRATTVGWNVV